MDERQVRRRTLLAGVAGALAATAGCTDDDDSRAGTDGDRDYGYGGEPVVTTDPSNFGGPLRDPNGAGDDSAIIAGFGGDGFGAGQQGYGEQGYGGVPLE